MVLNSKGTLLTPLILSVFICCKTFLEEILLIIMSLLILGDEEKFVNK